MTEAIVIPPKTWTTVAYWERPGGKDKKPNRNPYVMHGFFDPGDPVIHQLLLDAGGDSVGRPTYAVRATVDDTTIIGLVSGTMTQPLASWEYIVSPTISRISIQFYQSTEDTIWLPAPVMGFRTLDPPLRTPGEEGVIAWAHEMAALHEEEDAKRDAKRMAEWLNRADKVPTVPVPEPPKAPRKKKPVKQQPCPYAVGDRVQIDGPAGSRYLGIVGYVESIAYGSRTMVRVMSERDGLCYKVPVDCVQPAPPPRPATRMQALEFE